MCDHTKVSVLLKGQDRQHFKNKVTKDKDETEKLWDKWK